MKWIEAIVEVLQESKVAMTSEDIAIAISKTEKISTYQFSPDIAVVAIIEKNITIFETNERGAYRLKETFDYEQWKATDKTSSTEETKSIKERVDRRTKNLIKTYGVFWRREKVDWSQDKLRGSQLGGSHVDFSEMKGIYILYDNREPIFVGQAISAGLMAKLQTHTKDRFANRWNRFSWFGIYGVNQNGSLHQIRTFNTTIEDVANAIEAVLVEGLEPRQNRDNSRYFDGAEYSQCE